MISVVHIITKLELGGAQENTLYTCRHLDRRRFRVALLYGAGGMLDAEAERLPDARVEAVPDLLREIDPLHDGRSVLDLRRRLLDLHREHVRLGLDARGFVVHTHGSKAGIVGRLAARSAGVPVIVHTIHGFGFHPDQPAAKRWLFVRAERAAARCTDAFIGVSRANVAEARALGIIGERHRVRIIRSGMDLAPYREAALERDRARRELGLEPEDEVLLSIGNMKPQKDPLTLIEGVRLALESHPRAVLLFAGDGELRGEVERALDRARIAARVRLLGWRRDVPRLLAACDVVVLSSIFEGLPRAAIQALAAGRPFVGTRVDGTPEVIRDGKNGFLVEPRDPGALARAIDRALSERPVDATDQARIESWSAERMVEEQEALYQELVARARTA